MYRFCDFFTLFNSDIEVLNLAIDNFSPMVITLWQYHIHTETYNTEQIHVLKHYIF